MGQNFSSEPVVEKDTEKDQNELFNVAVSSCQGWRTSQEDNHSMILNLPGPHKASLFAVYDGHGSARVSKHASESLWKHLTENEAYKKGDFKQALENAFLTFDREVNQSYNAQLAGTTAVCILIVDNIVYCANIGDSRSVASIDCECVPLSHDHKPENPGELKRILAAGGYVLGNRVNGNLALSRAFGDFHYKGNDQLPPDQQIVSPWPDIQCIDLNDDVDFIVLACDGIWDVLSSEEVVKFVTNRLERNIEPALICEQLTTRCLATDYELVIGCDNMTVLLVCYTRGRSWEEYCTDIFNKNTKKLGIPRTRTFATDDLDQLDHQQRHFHSSQQHTRGNVSQEEQLISSNSLSRDRESNEDSATNTNNERPTTGDAAKNMSALLNMFEALGFGRFELGSHNMQDATSTNRSDQRYEDEAAAADEDRCKIEEVKDDDNNQESDQTSNQRAFESDASKSSSDEQQPPKSCSKESASSTSIEETTRADQPSVLFKPTDEGMCRVNDDMRGLNTGDTETKDRQPEDHQIDEGGNSCKTQDRAEQTVSEVQKEENEECREGAKDCDESSLQHQTNQDTQAKEVYLIIEDDENNDEPDANLEEIGDNLLDSIQDQADQDHSDDTQVLNNDDEQNITASQEQQQEELNEDEENAAENSNQNNDIIEGSGNDTESTNVDAADVEQDNSGEPDDSNAEANNIDDDGEKES